MAPEKQESIEKEYKELLEVIERDRKLDFHTYRPAFVERRINIRLRATGCNSIREYIKLIAKDRGEYDKLMSSMTINVTEFYRDRRVFDYLAKEIIPLIVQDAQDRVYTKIRCWSAGCADGPEPYTLGMLFAEHLLKKKLILPCTINATDIDRDCLGRAESGRYPHSAVKHVPPELLRKFFILSKTGTEHVISDIIRSMVRFSYHDMINQRPPMSNDLILCRNVLIYFTPPLQQKVIENFWRALRPGGYLVIGQTETLRESAVKFEAVDHRMRIFKKPNTRVAK